MSLSYGCIKEYLHCLVNLVLISQFVLQLRRSVRIQILSCNPLAISSCRVPTLTTLKLLSIDGIYRYRNADKKQSFRSGSVDQ